MIDFAIITALPKEAQAVVHCLEEHSTKRFEAHDIRTYHIGNVPITGTEQSYQVAVVVLPNMGEVSAANAVTDTIVRWKPRFLLMVGIAGGVPQDDLDLGDVVVADQVIGYEYGKETDHGFAPRDHVYPAGTLLLDRIRNFWDDSWADQIDYPRPTNAKRSRSKSFVGPIASGNKVIASTEFRKRLLDRWPKLHAVEMEAEGVFAAAFDRPQITQTLVIRGICDMADERKVDEWQEYAAHAAATFVINFLASGPVDVKTELDEAGQMNHSSPDPKDEDHSTSIQVGNISSSSGGIINIAVGDIIQNIQQKSADANQQQRSTGTSYAISSDLYKRIRQALLDCGPLDSDRQLRAVFAHPELMPWQYRLPEAGSAAERVDILIDYLSNKRHSNGKRVMITFLQVLNERIDPADVCYSQLLQLIQELESAL